MAIAIGASSLPARAAGTVVEGTVTLDGPAPTLPPLKITKDPSVCGPDRPSEAALVTAEGALRNVVVSLRPLNPTEAAPPAPGKATLDQVGCRYEPHVQAVTVGSELTLVNSDRVLHNVHGSFGPVTAFNLAMPIKGQRVPTKLTRPGLVRLQCDAGHTWMNAWVVVLREPAFAVTDEHGHFAIPDVAPGAYTIEYWHEPLDGRGAGVTQTSKLVVGAKPLRANAKMKL